MTSIIDLDISTPLIIKLIFQGRESRGEAEVGESVVGEAAKRHCPGVQGGFCAIHHGEEACHVCTLKPRPEGENEKNRLPETGR